MENWKELNNHKPNNNKKIKKIKREINKILLYGKQLSQTNLSGILHGAKEDLDGILNVQLWLILS